MPESPAISIVLPAYNEEKLIGRCLKSLKNQDFPHHFEIIVVNNNSVDKTAEIAASFDVRLVNESCQSVVYARQKGLLEARGEIVAGADCDSVYPTHWLSEIYGHFQNPEVVGVGGPAIADRHPWWAYLNYKWGFALVELIYKLTGLVLYLGGFNFAFRKKTFLDLGGYRTYLDFGGDELDPLQRLRKAGKNVYEPKAYMYLSTRRYRVGFFRWFFVHALYYYLINYILANLFKKTLIRSKPVRNI